MNKAEDKSWLFDSDRYSNLPDQIPVDFLVGKELVTERGRYVLRPKERVSERGGRTIKLEVIDFAFYGNTHKYGSLYIDGLEWYNAESGCTSMGSCFDMAEPLAAYSWKVELYKIIRKDDGFFDEVGYETGSRTQRFGERGELLATAVYVSLFRVLGPFSLYEGSYCTVPRKDDLIISVDENDNVSIGKVIKYDWEKYYKHH